MEFEFPFNIPTVASIIETINKSFYGHKEWLDKYSTNQVIWTPEDIKKPVENNYYLKDILWKNIYPDYELIFDEKLDSELKQRAGNFAIAIDSNYKNRPYFKTRIFNKSLLTDILHGQVIPREFQKYEILTWRLESSKTNFNDFSDYLFAELKETQTRARNNN